MKMYPQCHKVESVEKVFHLKLMEFSREKYPDFPFVTQIEPCETEHDGKKIRVFFESGCVSETVENTHDLTYRLEGNFFNILDFFKKKLTKTNAENRFKLFLTCGDLDIEIIDDCFVKATLHHNFKGDVKRIRVNVPCEQLETGSEVDPRYSSVIYNLNSPVSSDIVWTFPEDRADEYSEFLLDVLWALVFGKELDKTTNELMQYLGVSDV